MFTGIIQTASPVLSVSNAKSVRRVRIKKPAGWKLSLGQSVAVDGICSTVVAQARYSFDVEYMPETLKKTTAAFFAKGSLVNLERSLKYGDLIDGHLMQGHVDARSRIVATVERGRSREIILALPRTLVSRVMLHGSIAVNGVSLTVARRGRATCAVALIPLTSKHTNLRRVSVGDTVNLEIDKTALLAKQATRDRVSGNAAKRVRKKKKHR